MKTSVVIKFVTSNWRNVALTNYCRILLKYNQDKLVSSSRPFSFKFSKLDDEFLEIKENDGDQEGATMELNESHEVFQSPYIFCIRN